MRGQLRSGFAAALALSILGGCYAERVERVERAPTSVPRSEGPRDVRIQGRIDVDTERSHAFPGNAGVAVGWVASARRGSTLGVRLRAEPTSEVFVYGPLTDAGWSAAPVLGRGGGDGELNVTAPADGTYLVAALGPGDASSRLTLALRCASEECRVECGEGGACPTGAQCAFVQCARAPCPSWCQAMPPLPPGAEPPPTGGGDGPPGSEGATCGTRGAAPCADGLFCLYEPAARCGETDRPGTCQPRPEMCTREYRPVCGCDGRTHGNACTAHGNGTSVRHPGECREVGEGEDPSACVRGGCNGELCAEPGEQGMVSVCVRRPEHACYDAATCERQPDGTCGWTPTDELRACLQNARSQSR
ncbi:MAG TPA: Kazal-type serine protease inhibitor family protein [Sandaracinaceae bacterium LLY-WYZ-13_1]|nr:Kazal-type serine protease inhibitor family protein [Sandaracinaceae bacterium LLY-WYZ-13_1]